MEIKNINNVSFAQGIIKEIKPQRGVNKLLSNVVYIMPIFKKVFNFLHIAYYDECCNTISESGLPVGYRNNLLQYYNNITKTYITIPTGGIIPPPSPPVPPLQEFENNAAAIAGGLTEGQQYYLPYNNGSYVVAVVVTPHIAITFDNIKSVTKMIAFAFGPTTEVKVDWGDGSPLQVYTESGEFTFTHEYPSLQPYNAKIFLDDYSSLYNLNLASQEISSIQGTNLLTGIRNLDLNYNNLTAIPTIINNANIEGLNFSENFITIDSINNALIYLNNTFIAPFTFSSVIQTPAARPTGAGETAMTNLIANGCRITTD